MAVRPNGVIEVRGLDAIDGTPVLDIKPYFVEFAPRGDVKQPEWTHELMAHYWLTSPEEQPTLDPDRWMAEVRESPADHGRLDMIVRRPTVNEREILGSGELDVTVGLVGDNWLERGSRMMPDGSADSEAQLNIMNSRCARLVAGGDARMHLAGDQLFVDLDLSLENLPAGTPSCRSVPPSSRSRPGHTRAAPSSRADSGWRRIAGSTARPVRSNDCVASAPRSSSPARSPKATRS